MNNIYIGEISKLIIHQVGNKNNGDGVRFSTRETSFVNIKEHFTSLLNNNFKFEELFGFYFTPNIELNPVFQFVTLIFKDLNSFIEQSHNCARYLYDNSLHPKIKVGEFYTVYFKDCIVDGFNTNAVGLFKSENKDTFLKVFPSGDGFEIESEEGANINKLDKGCLIFNIEKDNGYVVAVVDNTNKGFEAQYWMDDFLHVRPRKDEYYNTQNILTLCKSYVTKELPQQFDVSKADQIDFLNKSVKFFKEKENFDIQDFVTQVISQPEIINSFNRFRQEFQRDQELELPDQFTISESAVKKQTRSIKSVIKLDKNFHIYVHRNRELIEQGVDEKGRKFYKIYYLEES